MVSRGKQSRVAGGWRGKGKQEIGEGGEGEGRLGREYEHEYLARCALRCLHALNMRWMRILRERNSTYRRVELDEMN